MSIQLVLLRPHYQTPEEITQDKKPRLFHKFPRKQSAPESIQDLFENNLKYLQELYPDERVNCFYTVAHCEPGAIRKFTHLDTLALDADGIDRSKILDYIPIVARILNISPDEMTVTSSGNGMHFLIKLQKNILEAELDDLQDHYTAVTQKMEAALKEAGLPAHFDMILDRGRILRMPGTVNRKHNKPETHATIVQKNFTPHNIQLKLLSGLPDVPEERAVNVSKFTKLTQPDTVTVLSSCEFLKWTRNSPTEVKEPQGYAAISVLAHLDNGREITKEYISRWTNSSSIAQWDADDKIDQATNAARARTCKDINNKWGKCSTCAFNGTVKSPISLKSPDFIASKTTGFHDVSVGPNGARKLVPNVHDLRKFFDQGATYRVVNKKLIYRWDQNQYRKMGELALPCFAEEHFIPKVKTNVIEEFVNVVTRYNVVEPDWFAESTEGFVNFQNGVLERRTGKLLSHDANRGFRYVLPFSYDENAQAGRWEQFLFEIFAGDMERAQLIEEFLGYAISNDPLWAQKALMLTGEGANGKSTLIKVFQALAGDGNYSAVKVDKFNEPTFVQMLDGKLFNISGETPRRGFEETAGIKEIIGGDIVTARELYGTPYTFQNRTKVVFACNEIPRTVDNTHGFYRRFWIVEFDQKFEGAAVDPNLDEKLSAELPGIFNRAYRAYQDAKGRGQFTEPQSTRAAIETLRAEMDIVGAWIGDALQTGDVGHFTTNAELYQSFVAHARKMGSEHAIKAYSSQRLVGRIKKTVGAVLHDKVAGERGLRGVSFKPGFVRDERSDKTSVHGVRPF